MPKDLLKNLLQRQMESVETMQFLLFLEDAMKRYIVNSNDFIQLLSTISK
jgi:hypothetical protein